MRSFSMPCSSRASNLQMPLHTLPALHALHANSVPKRAVELLHKGLSTAKTGMVNLECVHGRHLHVSQADGLCLCWIFVLSAWPWLGLRLAGWVHHYLAGLEQALDEVHLGSAQSGH